MDVSRITKLLETAGRDTTPMPERINAMTLAHKIMGSHGKTFADLDLRENNSRPMFPPNFNVPYAEWERRVEEAKKRLTEEQATSARLRKEIRDLTKRLEESERQIEQASRVRVKTDDDGSMDFHAFRTLVTTKLGVAQWTVPFMKQTGFTDSQVARWRTSARAPADAVEAAKKLKPLPPKIKAAPDERSESKWTFEADDEIAKLSTTMSVNRIVKELNARHAKGEWPFVVTEGMVKFCRQRIQSRTAILELYDGGLHDAAAISAKLTGQLARSQAAVSVAAVERVLAHYRPEASKAA